MAISIVDNEFMVCADCQMIIANDDASGLDYRLDEEASAQRKAEIRECIEAVDGHISLGDSEKDEDFSSQGCDCCGTRLAGARYHFIVTKAA